MKNKTISTPKAFVAYPKERLYPKENTEDRINHPKHYEWLKEVCGVEAIDICRHFNFNLGNALKYILRAGRKTEQSYTNKDKEIEDIKKAIWYLQDYINILTDKK